MANLKRPPWTPEQLRVLEVCTRTMERAPHYKDRVKKDGRRVLKWYASVPTAAQRLMDALNRADLAAEVYYNRHGWMHSPNLLVYAGMGAPRPSCLPEHILRWQDRTVPRICENIRKTRNFTQMGILADALADAGCDDDKLVDDCRKYAGWAVKFAERRELRKNTPRDQELPPWKRPPEPNGQCSKILKAILGIW